ncbi:MAG: pyruvate kinase [Thiotrichales bacterium]|nr:pyruvate kinase [Thiotrichales bacterium]
MSINTEINLLKMRRTKILATLGPATCARDKIRQLVEAGVNVFRLNMSHGDHAFHEQTYSALRSISREMDRTIGILADLCGPKIRTGKFKNDSIELETGSEVVVTTRDVIGDKDLIPSQYEALADDVQKDDHILLADGTLELVVQKVEATEITCKVMFGGTLGNHKGINLPGVNVSAPALTEKDREDAAFAMQLGVDFFALSFVRRGSDVEDLRNIIRSADKDISIIAKIEKPEALDEAQAIIDAADGIMVARGDLGVELKPELVPVAQQQLIDMAHKKFKPVIVATQMLESMIENARPTRAEVTDVSNAVTQGTDAVMLSGETAVGVHPIEAVRMMDRVARQTEAYLWKQNAYGAVKKNRENTSMSIWDAIANAMSRMSLELRVNSVIVISQSGITAATMSSARPSAPIIAITKHPEICRRLTLLWGVIPVLSDQAGSANPNELARSIAREAHLAEEGKKILLIRGFHEDEKLNTPSITAIIV